VPTQFTIFLEDITMREYGLLLNTVSEYGTPYIKVSVVSRESGKDHPLFCDSDGEMEHNPDVPKHMQGLLLAGLGLYGFVTDATTTSFIAGEPEYRDIIAVDLRRSERMVKTLTRISARMHKDRAYEPGDQFSALAASLKLTFAVEQVASGGNIRREWRWMSLAEGRNRYRDLIDSTRATVMERKHSSVTT
jgi:hypothetical protein